MQNLYNYIIECSILEIITNLTYTDDVCPAKSFVINNNSLSISICKFNIVGILFLWNEIELYCRK